MSGQGAEGGVEGVEWRERAQRRGRVEGRE
jgi:hypothetical protein